MATLAAGAAESAGFVPMQAWAVVIAVFVLGS